MPKKKKKPAEMPKPRHGWAINPKTRVKPSEKVYKRSESKKKARTWIDDVHWFGE